MFTADNLSSLTHGFLTRRGGVSRGLYASLNLAVTKGDALESVRQNRGRALKRLGAPQAQLVIAHQVHSKRVVVVETPWRFGIDQAPQADALVTTQPGLVLGVLTADCVPILLADSEAGVIATTHAGWKGLQKGIINEVIKVMCQQGAKSSQIRAAIGPCIHQLSYEVGQEVHDAFVQTGLEAQAYFQPRKTHGKYLFDLPGLAKGFLKQAGVQSVSQVKIDTYDHEDLFFSCRRATHQQEHSFGCQLSAIAL